MTLGTNRRWYLNVTYILYKIIGLKLFHASYHVNLYRTVGVSEVAEFTGYNKKLIGFYSYNKTN